MVAAFLFKKNRKAGRMFAFRLISVCQVFFFLGRFRNTKAMIPKKMAQSVMNSASWGLELCSIASDKNATTTIANNTVLALRSMQPTPLAMSVRK